MNRSGRARITFGWMWAIVSVVSACSSSDVAGGDMNELRWDLRQPTSTRELGSESNFEVNKVAPRGELLDVEILLPGVTVRGAWQMVTGATFGVELDQPPQPVADLTLYDRDVESMDDLRTILLRFERDWGFTEEDCAEATALVREGDVKMAEAGGDPMNVTPWSTTVFGLSGRPRNGVQPGLVVRLPAPNFSTYTRLAWDPAVKPDGDHEIVGSPDGSSEVLESSSCVPPPASG